ncbi:MAG: PASTA domain-containing protein, partial [Lachnospiraceae bacterium]|nr:PASTA domain-containing protein [Lachnospiraceae bacterium]
LVIGTAAFGTVTAISTMRTEKKEKVYSAEDMLPQYESQTEAEAIEDLKKYSLTPEITYQYNPDRTENTVIEMQPSAGTQISSIDSVQLTVESSQTVTMPDLTGMTTSQVQSTLQELCKGRYQKEMLTYNYTADDTAKGICYAQSKQGDIQVDDLSNFQTQISWGKESSYQTEMPNLEGMTVDKARKTLQKRGITSKVRVSHRIADDAEKGEVLSQNIPVGKTLNINKEDKVNYNVPTTIEVTISEGPAPTPKPTPVPTKQAMPSPKATKSSKVHSNKHDIKADGYFDD